MRWKRRPRRGSAGNPQSPPPHSAPWPGTGGYAVGERGQSWGGSCCSKSHEWLFSACLALYPIVSTGPCKEVTEAAFPHPRAEGSAAAQGAHIHFPGTELGWPQASVPPC